MNLFSSILTSILIIVAVWFTVIYQPTPAYAEMTTVSTTDVIAQSMLENESPVAMVKTNSVQKIEKTVTKSAVNNAPVHSILGVEQEILISNVDSLWSEFAQQNALHKKLIDYPSATYVLYRNISDDFSRANITVGYDSRELKGRLSGSLLPKGQYQTVIADSRLSSEQLESAWKKLDFSKDILAVVERHQLNKRGEVISVSMQVLYK